MGELQKAGDQLQKACKLIQPTEGLSVPSEAPPQTDENRMESISPQSRGARRDDSSFFFAAETPAKKNRHALRARPDKFRQLTRSVRSFPFLPSSAPWNGRSLFLRGQQKREKRFPLRSLCL